MHCRRALCRAAAALVAGRAAWCRGRADQTTWSDSVSPAGVGTVAHISYRAAGAPIALSVAPIAGAGAGAARAADVFDLPRDLRRCRVLLAQSEHDYLGAAGDTIL